MCVLLVEYRGQVAIDWLNVFWQPKEVGEYKPNVRFVTSYNVEIVDQMIHEAVNKKKTVSSN